MDDEATGEILRLLLLLLLVRRRRLLLLLHLGCTRALSESQCYLVLGFMFVIRTRRPNTRPSLIPEPRG